MRTQIKTTNRTRIKYLAVYQDTVENSKSWHRKGLCHNKKKQQEGRLNRESYTEKYTKKEIEEELGKKKTSNSRIKEKEAKKGLQKSGEKIF